MHVWVSVTVVIWCYCAVGPSAGQITSSATATLTEQEVLDLFVDFVNKYNKPYKLDSDEFIKRLSVFKESLERHRHLNQGEKTNHSSSALYGITKFADLTAEEFRGKYLRDIRNSTHVFSKDDFSRIVNVYNFTKAIPKKVDWREKGVISAVKNQLQCGACWAFSSVETVESMYALKTQRPVPDLSVQEVIDCARGNLGCDGGDTCTALDWMVQSRYPLVPEPEYPLTDKSQSCQILTNGTAGVVVKNHTCFKQFVKDESGMLLLLANIGPLTVSVDATTWNDYLGGIIQYHCRGPSNNHAVQIVGYDLTGEVPFYIVRNSWGADFGNAGYLYIKYGGNVCGIAREVSSVTV